MATYCIVRANGQSVCCPLSVLLATCDFFGVICFCFWVGRTDGIITMVLFVVDVDFGVLSRYCCCGRVHDDCGIYFVGQIGIFRRLYVCTHIH